MDCVGDVGGEGEAECEGETGIVVSVGDLNWYCKILRLISWGKRN